MQANLGAIVRQHQATCTQRYALSAEQRHAARQIGRCRTPALGGHLQICPAGHTQRRWYHSCRHRSCPQCQRLASAHWLARLETRLLPVAHHHLIFTIPHELNALWCANRRAMGQLLFAVTHRTLQHFLADPRHLGATPGILMALHSWGRALGIHPHVHVLITDGGLTDAGHWHAPRRSHFLPARALMAAFRGRLLADVCAQLDAGALRLPRDWDLALWRRTLTRLHRLKWNVHVRTRYAHGHGVAAYLARYVRGGPMNNSQIVHADATQVRFRHLDHATGDQAFLTLAPAAFLQRVLSHVAPTGQHQLRAYGLYAPRATARRARALAVIAPAAASASAPSPVTTPPEHWSHYLQRLGAPRTHTHCPTCGCAFVRGPRIRCGASPPSADTGVAP